MVEAYVIDIKKRINPNSISTYVNPIKTFLEEIYVDKIRYDRSTKCWSLIIPEDDINSDNFDPDEVSKN